MSSPSPARAQAATLCGIEAYIVDIEVQVKQGTPRIEILGLGQPAARESRERVRAALRSCGFDLNSRSFLVNLTSTALLQDGAPLDLAIALAVLVAGHDLPQDTLDGRLICGELGLNGDIRSIRGGLAIAELGRRLESRELLIPAANTPEAGSLATNLPVIGLLSLKQALLHLKGAEPLTPSSASPLAMPIHSLPPDLSEVRGQEHAKRVLEVAAAGGHNLLLLGPPGSGKTMLARRMPGLLPPLTLAESMELTKIYSLVSEEPQPGLCQIRPFRSPHSATSPAGIRGGGFNSPRPGEATLAHHGVLFLDELPEFSRGTLEALLQPLEEGIVTVVRARRSVRFPARFSLLAAMGPCPCGHLGDPRFSCTCTPNLIRLYRERISGPLLDRFDLHVEVPAVCLNELRSGPGETTAEVARRVAAARALQVDRFGTTTPRPLNAAMSPEEIQRFCTLDGSGRSLLEAAFEKFGLSVADTHRILKVARTIADLAGCDAIRPSHLAEAIQYRSFDRRIGL